MRSRFAAIPIAVAGFASFLGMLVQDADATTVQVNSVTGVWSNIVGGTNVAISGSDPTTVSWGSGGTSSYVFDGVAPPPVGPFLPGSSFDLGTFTHNNNSINAGTSITAATLTLGINALIDTGVSTQVIDLSSVFDITHFETPNGDNPCAGGTGPQGVGVNSNGCADIVSIATNVGGSTSINLGGIDYVFAFTGFLIDGNTFSQFFTKEANSNQAFLQGSFIQKELVVNPVPIPAALPLFAGGLGLLGWMARRKRKTEQLA